MPSTIRGNDNFDSAYGAALKAWVNFNGTGTVAIRASRNVSSITDNGTGDYTINFTTALASANYCVLGTGVSANATTTTTNIAVAGSVASGPTTKTTSAVRVLNAGTSSAVDSAEQNIAVFAN